MARIRLLLVVLIVAAGSALFWLPSGASQAGPSDDGEGTEVLFVNRYVPAFTAIKPEWIVRRPLPKQFMAPGALHLVDELVDQDGRPVFMSAVALPDGQPLTRAVLLEIDRHHGMSAALAPGKVAVSFSVDDVHGVGGWVRPGDLVAVLSAAPDPATGKMTKLLFPAVTILAVNQDRLGATKMEKEGEPLTGFTEGTGARTLTVVLNPAQALTLIEARERGSLSVVLRAQGDDLPWAL
jgi:pilus assembly protein CpaB